MVPALISGSLIGAINAVLCEGFFMYFPVVFCLVESAVFSVFLRCLLAGVVCNLS